MSGQLRALRNRIRSVESTKKITRAMEMVAASKLRKFQDVMAKSRPYTEGLAKLLFRLSNGSIKKTHPLIQSGSGVRTGLLLFTSDTGLCGSYNHDLVVMAKRFLKEQPEKPYIITVGKAGFSALKQMGYACAENFTDIRASRIESILQELKTVLEKVFLSGEVHSFYAVYSHFKTATTYQAVTQKILPLATPDQKAEDEPSEDYIFEPSREVIFEKLIPLFFEAMVRTIFLQAIVSEQIARMTAMNQATKNAREMIDSLVLQRNKARQAAITKEIIEIVSGSQALKIK